MLPRDISTPFSHAHLFVRTPLLNYSFLTSFNKIPFSMQPFKSKLTARDKRGDEGPTVCHQNTLRVTPNASPEFSGSGAVSRCKFENRGQGGRNIQEHHVWASPKFVLTAGDLLPEYYKKFLLWLPCNKRLWMTHIWSKHEEKNYSKGAEEIILLITLKAM